MRVAIVHYWLVTMRGGERVLEALCELFPQADIFTHVYRPDRVSPAIRRHRVTTTFIDRIPMADRLYRRSLPLMPWALHTLNLGQYDLVISSESGPAKGVRIPPHALHVCYCHTPMRYLWSHFDHYRDRAGPVTRLAMDLLVGPLRRWDVRGARGVDRFVANSTAVAGRIERYYGRDSTVVSPPVDVEAFELAEAAGDFYLWVGELVSYKRVDLAVQACSRLDRRLVVIGDGAERRRLERMAGPGIEFLGVQPVETLRWHYANCRALLFPGEEDFGIVPVEAMASGRPVIAYRAGGALDTVIDGRTGLFFEHPDVESLERAIESLESRVASFDPVAIRDHARRFGRERFKRRFETLIGEWSCEKRAAGAVRNRTGAAPSSHATGGQ